MIDPGQYVRSGSRTLDLGSLLRRQTEALIGVSPVAGAELAAQNIDTIFDLATSSLFRAAGELVAAADDASADWSLAGVAPSEVVDVADQPVQLIADRPLADLRALSDTAAAQIGAALAVSTIRELSLWPPYRAAVALYRSFLGVEDPAALLDPGTPPELLPTMGRHPTERVYYQNILLDHLVEPPPPAVPVVDIGEGRAYARRPGPRAPIAIETAGQIDVTAPLLSSPGFEQVALGAVVQMSQSWYTSGLSLGQLLHSLALAPGESTRIAMIDWQRRTAGSQTQNTVENDVLTSNQAHTRSLNEVVAAVAHENQWGHSAAEGSGESWGVGKSGGGGMSWGGEGMGAGFGGGYSIGYGTGNSRASSWSSSGGDRNLSSSLTQNITDLTHQASTMARSRWATVVQEVSESEHEQLSTRAVTNFNHMHALTVQYFEVVQLYRVSIEIDRITRCIFVPMRIVDFSSRAITTRFRDVIVAAALIPQIRVAFRATAGAVVLGLAAPGATWQLPTVTRVYGPDAWTPGAAEVVLPIDDWMGPVIGCNAENQPFRSLVVERTDGTAQVVPWVISNRTAPDAGSPYGYFDYVGPPTTQGGRALSGVRRLLLRRSADGEAFAGPLNIDFFGRSQREDSAWTGGTITLHVTPGSEDIPLLTVEPGYDFSTVLDHLRDNALHYSQAIWQSLDTAAITLALAGFSLGGRPMMESVDPVAVGVAGNYLILRSYAQDDDWEAFLKAKNLRVGPVSSTVVPLPSGGVFAEAVLGRSNSAERLDMTRFWNWQDSPIPLIAPDIAALQAGSRSQPVTLETGELTPSILNIMAPSSLPDPSGMTAALTALAQGSLFRDMSGMAGTVGLAGTALTEAYRGSSDAQKYAAQNFATAASIFAKGAKPPTSTEESAKVAQGKGMDAREKADPGSVGPAERKAFEASLSAPPLVQATPSSEGEWAPWPGATDTPQPVPVPPKRTGTTKPRKVVPVTVALRVFVPAELWEAFPSVFNTGPEALRAFRFAGDNRGFQATGGSSRAELECSLRINADTMAVTETTTKPVKYGTAALYLLTDSVAVAGKPDWWEAKSGPGVQPVGGMMKRMASDKGVFTAEVDELGDRIEVVFTLRAQPQFPWTAADITLAPDIDVFGLKLPWILDQVIDQAARDIDARVVLTITKRSDGMLQYSVSGSHDGFPAYELYVNGEAAYRFGTDQDLVDDNAPENLALDTRTISVDELRVIPTAP